MLTLRQNQTLHFIRDYARAKGSPPSFEEMMTGLGLKSKSHVHHLLKSIEDRGFIRRLKGRTRAIEILKSPPPIGTGGAAKEVLAMNNLSAAPAQQESELPSFERLAALHPVKLEGRPIRDVISDVNTSIVAAGIEFPEGGFSVSRHDPSLPATFDQYRWIDCTAVRGANEGYFVHVTAVPRDHDRSPSRLVAMAKTWDWATALAIAAAATRLLGD